MHRKFEKVVGKEKWFIYGNLGHGFTHKKSLKTGGR